MKLITIFSFCAGGLLLSMSCAKNSTTALIEDDSASGAIAAAVGGALSNSISSGSLSLNKTPEFFNPTISRELASFVPPSLASNACPTFASTDAGCTYSGSSQWLSYLECNFANSPATWTGTQLLKTSSGAATCGNLPNPGPSGSLLRQFVAGTSSLTPASAIRTAASGGVITLDDATANLNNFDHQAIAPLANSGYGTLVTFGSNGARSSVTIARRIYSGTRFDHSLSGTLSISEASSASSTRTVSGTITDYHNLLRVIGTSTFNQVTHSNTCCVPVSGSITTTFTSGSVAATSLGNRLVGKSETLTFTGCGTALFLSAEAMAKEINFGTCF